MIKFWQDRVSKDNDGFTFSEWVPQFLGSVRRGVTLAEGATHGDGAPTIAHLGFTLAETLITLGIIGVVAAMTIPNLIATHQKKQTVVKLQKAISVMNQAYRLAYDDVGEVTAEEARALGAQNYFDKFWAPYIKVLSLCNVTGCGYDKPAPWKYPNGSSTNLLIETRWSRVIFTSMDGFLYAVITVTGADKDLRTSSSIYVDINGTAKPNTFGRDVFLLERKIDGEKGGVVVPACSTLTNTDVNNNCSKSGGGDCCAEKIKRAGWRIDKSYPWK